MKHDGFLSLLATALTSLFRAIPNAETIVAVESPIEALSYHSLFAGRHDRLAVVSCAGSFVPDELMAQACIRRQSFVVALNNDDAGELGLQGVRESAADWPGFKLLSECPRRNDWNADLVASGRAARATRAQRRPSLHL